MPRHNALVRGYGAHPAADARRNGNSFSPRGAIGRISRPPPALLLRSLGRSEMCALRATDVLVRPDGRSHIRHLSPNAKSRATSLPLESASELILLRRRQTPRAKIRSAL